MELGSVIFGLLAVACFVVPVIYLQRVKKIEREKVLKEFLLLAEQEQLRISTFDFWNHAFAIGIDTHKNKLFFFKKEEGKAKKMLIDLSEVEKCSLINISRLVNDSRVVDYLGIAFAFKNAKFPEKNLYFYNKEESLSVNDELQLSGKWKDIITAHLQTLPVQTATVKVLSNTRTAA